MVEVGWSFSEHKTLELLALLCVMDTVRLPSQDFRALFHALQCIDCRCWYWQWCRNDFLLFRCSLIIYFG